MPSGVALTTMSKPKAFSEETVQLYHDLFLDVRGKLHLREWIVGAAIGEKVWYGITETDVDVFLKHLGFIKGPFMILALERYFREARLQRLAPVPQEMVLNYLAEHVLGLPRSY